MYAAVDIGGTKTLVAVFNTEGEVVEEIKFPTPNEYPLFISEMATNVAKLSTTEFSAGAVGMPGAVDRLTGVSISAGGNLTWQHSPIAEDFSKLFGCKIIVENDANLAGLSEAVLVKDRYNQVLYITISTGIGGVYVIGGKIDMNTINAEVGHMIFKEDGVYKTWEALSSGKTLVARYGKKASEIDDPKVWSEFTENIAVGIINICAVLTPDVVIIGGGAGANLPKFQAQLDEWIQNITPKAIKVPAIQVAARPDEAVIYGCYELAKDFAST